MPAELSGSHILLVEDDRIMRAILAERLAPVGAEISVVPNAEGALAFLEERRPTLVLSDAVMPGMDGFELCRRVRTDPRFRTLPFAMFTSLVQDIQARSLEAGADDFISKNAEDAALRIRVRMLLGLGADTGATPVVAVISASSTVRSLLQAHLGTTNIQVRVATDRRELQQVLDGGMVDALVVDTDLGEDSAIGLVRTVNDVPWKARLPILLLVGKEEESFLEPLEDRIQDFLYKPLTAREDRHRLRLLLRLAQGLAGH